MGTPILEMTRDGTLETSSHLPQGTQPISCGTPCLLFPQPVPAPQAIGALLVGSHMPRAELELCLSPPGPSPTSTEPHLGRARGQSNGASPLKAGSGGRGLKQLRRGNSPQSSEANPGTSPAPSPPTNATLHPAPAGSKGGPGFGTDRPLLLLSLQASGTPH